MATKKEGGKKGGFSLAPIMLAQPVKATDGFTNLVESPSIKAEKTTEPLKEQGKGSNVITTKKTSSKREVGVTAAKQSAPKRKAIDDGAGARRDGLTKTDEEQALTGGEKTNDFALTENELLRILDAESLDEIYELSDVLRASSLKLYATLVNLADSRGRARVKNHELMSKAGIKGIATLYKQERWLMDLKLLEKKAKPGPHDGSSYVIHKLETLPLPVEIYEKFDEYLSSRQLT